MSCPARLYSLQNGEITGVIHHNWGWISPTEYQIATKILRLVEKVPGEFASGTLSAAWDKLNVTPFGMLPKEKYWELYDTLKNIHYGLTSESDFDLSKFIEDYE